jgi:hypothetical protein
MITTLTRYIKESYLPDDSIGYDVGEFIYHTTPKKNLDYILSNGLKPRDGVSIDGKSFKNRLYFATSLIAVYDLYVNFTSIRQYEDYIIIKIDSKCLEHGYSLDNLFVHGIYIDYPIDKNCIVDIIDAESLFNKFNEDDLENLYL